MTPTMRRYLEGRLFEWVAAVCMIFIATQIFIWPDTILGADSFTLLLHFIPGFYIAIFLLLFGIGRLFSLIANGRSKVYGPRIRAYGAAAGSVLWAQFALSLADSIAIHPSPNIPIWTSFALAEIYTAYRAASDEISNARH